jgi:hypothetical protein
MVQTEQQYICIHQCLMAVLEGKENTGSNREIHDNQGYEGKVYDCLTWNWKTVEFDWDFEASLVLAQTVASLPILFVIGGLVRWGIS